MVLMIATIALAWTMIVAYGFRAHKNWLVTFLQGFTGWLFVFSGAVKAVDPLGTAYKMEQYFAEFESLFQGTWFDFLAPVFPSLGAASDTFSVIMIVFEIVLGIMLLIGAKPKLTAWLFFLLVFFFLILTGFTYLTGYVPFGANFFEFSKWGAFEESNMKVTDCGCFGDFVKLKPFTSFMKDVVLMVPALIFLFASKEMHRIFTPLGRSVIIWVSTIALVIYCMANYAWNLPHIDFRPFKEGTNVAEQRRLEEEAMGNVQIIAYKLTNRETGEVQEIPYEEYLKRFSEFPKEQYESEQIKTQPEIEPTKISEFDVEDIDGNYVTEDILQEPGYHIMIVADKIPAKAQGEGYAFPDKYLKAYAKKINPLIEAAQQAGWKTYLVAGIADPVMYAAFQQASGLNAPIYKADDILLKTIIRSNPGIVLWKEGKILEKWHVKRLPAPEKVIGKYSN
jgi:uncharacterized membrane protein YphA (DoxX/SURF4 family)